MPHLPFLTKIPDAEKTEFDEFIRNTREKFISPPKETVKSVLNQHAELMVLLQERREVSQVIRSLREEAFEQRILHHLICF